MQLLLTEPNALQRPLSQAKLALTAAMLMAPLWHLASPHMRMQVVWHGTTIVLLVEAIRRTCTAWLIISCACRWQRDWLSPLHIPVSLMCCCLPYPFAGTFSIRRCTSQGPSLQPTRSSHRCICFCDRVSTIHTVARRSCRRGRATVSVNDSLLYLLASLPTWQRSFSSAAATAGVPVFPARHLMLYTLRMVFALLLLEACLHHVPVFAIVSSGLYRQWSCADVSMLGYTVLNVIWLKFLVR